MPSRVGGAPTPQPTSATEPQAPRPAVERSEARAAQGWAPKLAGKAKDAARGAVLDEAAKERELVSVGHATTLGGVGLSASAKVTEKVLLKPDDPFVAGDRRRKAAADSGAVVWTRFSATGASSASGGTALSPHASASFGLSAGAEVTALVAADKRLGVKNLLGTVRDQGETLALTLDPDRLLADGHPPGTELMLRGHAAESASVGAGLGLPGLAAANLGVGVSASRSDEFTKNVKVLEDGKVYAQVAKVGSSAESVSAGLTAGLALPRADAAGALVAKGVDRVEKKVEDRVRLAASVGASAGQTDTLRLGGVFDLKTEQGRDAFAYLMKSNPLELRANPRQAETTLRNMGMGVAYAESTRTGGAAANLQVGQTTLLSISSSRRSTEGVLLEKKDGAGSVVEKKQLTELEYSRNVSGALPRLMLGEERSLSLRAGSVQQDGVETKAALASLSLKDPQVTEGEQRQLAAFASQLGLSLPPAGKAGGAGTMAVQVALTDANLQQLQQRSADEIKTAFAFAKGSLEGSPAPWESSALAAVNPNYRYAPQRSVKEEFLEARKGLEDVATFGDPDGDKAKLVRDYKATTGRDLQRDVESYDAMNRIGDELAKVRGKPVSEWGPALSAIGAQSSADVRTALVALNRLAGASLVSLSVDANGATVNATAAPAPKSAAELVGPILTPAGVS